MTRSAVLGLFLSLGCGGEASLGDAPSSSSEGIPPQPEHVTEATDPRCELTLSPDPELEDWTREGAARWSDATGCDLHLGEGGVRVEMVFPLPTECGGEDIAGCAYTERLLVNAAANFKATTVLHELGHRIAGPDHVPTIGHVMSPAYGESTLLSAQDVGLACDWLHCRAFNPER